MNLGVWLAENRNSVRHDGTSRTAFRAIFARLCLASGVGARIFADRIPSVQIPGSIATKGLNIHPLQMALHGGEDYELLFTDSPQQSRAVAQSAGILRTFP